MSVLRKIVICVPLLTFAIVGWALDIDAAKKAGLIGEAKTGYVEAVIDQPDNQLRALIKDINVKRKDKYEKIAKKRGLSLDAVEQLAARKTYEKTLPGHYIQGDDRQWVKK